MLQDWRYGNSVVHLTYDDGDVLQVRLSDFNRAFGTIINSTKEEVLREFVLKD